MEGRRRWFWDLLFPRRCVGCGSEGKYLCEKCLQTVDFEPIQRCAVCNGVAISGKTHERCRSPWGLDGVWAACGYRGVVKKLLRGLKYRQVKQMDKVLIELLVQKLPNFFEEYDLVVPMPLYAARWRWRGFNQAELLARGLGRKLCLSVDGSILSRVRYKDPQAKIHLRTERLKNVEAKVFKLKVGSGLKNKSILLVDDIVTTGSTLRAAAQVLKRAGARQVWGVVVAR